MWCELNLNAQLSEAQITRLVNFFDSPPEAGNQEEGLHDVEQLDTPTTPLVDRPDSEAAAGVASWNEMEIEKSTNSSSSSLLNRKAGDHDLRWINSCIIGASSNTDILVLALVQKFVIFERLSNGRMELNAEVEVDHNIDVSEGYITQFCILPIASPGNRKSDTSVNDWTCVAVALSSGYVNFYSERGVLVFSERFSHYPINSIRFGVSAKSRGQELAVLTENQLVVIEGSSLYNTLRTARAKRARKEETVEEICNSLEVKCHRYDMSVDREGVVDFIITGPQKPSSVDQYVAASLSENGVETRLVRSSLPTYSTYMCIGNSPFTSFSWFDESGGSQNIISDTIHNIKNQVTSAVTSQLPSFGIRTFLGIGTSRKDRPPKTFPTDVRSLSMPTRSSLDDEGRFGERIYGAPPQWNLAAVADDAARVLLIHTKTRQIHRIWKGYREARCAWIESTGRVASGSSGKALFLVIFAPRRGLLEIWAMQNGPRVSAFNVDRNGRLISVASTSHLLLGHTEQKVDTLNSAVFISSNGEIHNLVVPFHLALSGSSTASVHDENLLKEIYNEKSFDEDKFKRFVDKMKTVSTRRKAAEYFVDLPDVDVAVKGRFCESLRKEIDIKQDNVKSVSAEAQLFHSYLKSVLQIMDVYATVDSFGSVEESTNVEELAKDVISRNLRMNMEELMDMMDCMNRYSPIDDPSEEGLEMKAEERYDFVSFLKEFSFEHISGSASPTAENRDCLMWIPQKLKDECSISLGQFLFLPVLSGHCSTSDFFKRVAPCSGIEQTTLVECFCAFWLRKANNQPTFYLPHVLSFVEQLFEFASNGKRDEEKIAQIFERHITKSSELIAALFLCLVVRATILNRKQMECTPEKDEEVAEEDEAMEVTEHWEPIEIGLQHWDLLLTHLRCLSVLASLPKAGEHSLEKLKTRGCGYYREQIGVWVASYMVDPQELYEVLSRPLTFDDHCEIDDFREPLEKEMKDALEKGEHVEPWKYAIYDLRKRFPVSLTWNLVICDCAWECFTHWHRLTGTKPVTLLKNAVRFVKFLNSWPHLQHGIALIAWDTFLREPFQKVYNLLNEKGVQPPDHIIRGAVGVSETELGDFTDVMRDVLQLLCVSVVDLDQIPLPKQEYEDFLLYFVDFGKSQSTTKSSSSNHNYCLSEMICRKKSVNYHLVLHHIHLATVMQLQIATHARVKPASLFCDNGQRALFESFHCHPLIPLDRVGDHLKAKRQNFALNIVKHINETFASDEAGNKKLWGVLLDLTRDWQLDTDELRRREIELLYKDAYDQKAAHLIPPIVNRGTLGAELFKITVSRLKALHDDLQGKVDLLKEFEKYQLGSAKTINLIRATPEKFATHHEIEWKDLRELASVADDLLQSGDRENPALRQFQKSAGELIKMVDHAKRFVNCDT
ncbi:hypothetical protein L596_008299 [Steinernema carpocapsae]|uniref:Rab3-GAP regulatory subunit N-terminal domain-containing protein n=1 Tax=Steinernema carpocapsae TaxID=34508 RepID=A0A4U5PC70_STECR|nr:hypothetical protein L596_008299 [Steinernema carpocapsae]